MNSSKILETLLNERGVAVESKSVAEKSALFTQMYDLLCETLTDEQREFLSDIDYVGAVLQREVFSDGVVYGMKLSHELRGLIENPTAGYEEMKSARTPDTRGHDAKCEFEKYVVEMKSSAPAI